MRHDIFERIKEPPADKKAGAEIPNNSYHNYNNYKPNPPLRNKGQYFIYFIKCGIEDKSCDCNRAQ